MREIIRFYTVHVLEGCAACYTQGNPYTSFSEFETMVGLG